MGKTRIQDHKTNGAEIITATDMSCLMHLDGIIRREKKAVKVMNTGEILNSSLWTDRKQKPGNLYGKIPEWRMGKK